MKKYYRSWVLVLWVVVVHAQSPRKLDSLRTVLAQLPPEGRSYTGDTTRVRVLCEVGEEQLKASKDSILINGQQAFKLAQKVNFKMGEMRANTLIGRYYYVENLYVKAIEHLLKALVIAENLGNISSQILLNKMLGFNYSALKQHSVAISYINKQMELCKKYATPEDYLLAANNLGIVYFDKKDYSEALKHFEVCEREGKRIQNKKILNSGLINVALVLTTLKRYNEALKRYDEALSIEDGYSDKVPFILNAKANIYLQTKTFDKALQNANEALKTQNSPAHLKAICLTLSQAYQSTNNYNKAFDYYKQYATISLKEDSLKNTQLVRLMNLDYQSEKQLLYIQELNFNQERQTLQRNIAIGISILALVILAVIYFFYQSLQKKNVEIEKQKSAIEYLNTTLEQKVEQRTSELSNANQELIQKNREIIEALFKGQTLERKRVASELHDNLGSTLSAIKWRLEALDGSNLTEKEKIVYASIVAMMKNAYDDVRHISHNLLPAEFEERGLVGAIEKLCKDLNEGEKVAMTFDYQGDLENIDNKIALELYSICMECVNNILKHSRANKAAIVLRNDQEALQLTIKDNGVGITKETKKNGIGFINLADRVQAVAGRLEVGSDEIWETVIDVTIKS